MLLVSVISPALGPTKFHEQVGWGNCHAAVHMRDVEAWLIAHWTPGGAIPRNDGEIGRQSKLEIDTWKGRGSANGTGGVFSEYRREAGRRGGTRDPEGPEVRKR